MSNDTQPKAANPRAAIATTDTTFAAAMMAHGGKCTRWRDAGGGRVEWTVEGIPGDAIEEYKSGRDRFALFARNKRLLSQMADTYLSGNGQEPTIKNQP